MSSPAIERLYFESDESLKGVRMMLLDVQGRVQRSYDSLVDQGVDVSDVASGTYFYQVMVGGKMYHGKFIKD